MKLACPVDDICEVDEAVLAVTPSPDQFCFDIIQASFTDKYISQLVDVRLEPDQAKKLHSLLSQWLEHYGPTEVPRETAQEVHGPIAYGEVTLPGRRTDYRFGPD